MTDSARDPVSSRSRGPGGADSSRRPLILLFDGLCGFCDSTVQFVLRRDRKGTLLFAPLGGPTATGVLDRHPKLKSIDSLVLVEGEGDQETVAVRSEAIIRLGGYLGGVWAFARTLKVVPAPVRDWFYALFARHRYRVFGRYDVCPLPAPEVRNRFLP